MRCLCGPGCCGQRSVCGLTSRFISNDSPPADVGMPLMVKSAGRSTASIVRRTFVCVHTAGMKDWVKKQCYALGNLVKTHTLLLKWGFTFFSSIHRDDIAIGDHPSIKSRCTACFGKHPCILMTLSAGSSRGESLRPPRPTGPGRHCLAETKLHGPAGVRATFTSSEPAGSIAEGRM